jgi:hypothetical protein
MQHAINSTLASKLERALAWQLSLSRKNNASRTTATRTGSGDSYGMFVTADGRFSGRPLRAKGITSSSAMWDQIRMGWKCVFLFFFYAMAPMYVGTRYHEDWTWLLTGAGEDNGVSLRFHIFVIPLSAPAPVTGPATQRCACWARWWPGASSPLQAWCLRPA